MNDWDIIELFWQRSEQALTEVSRKFGSYCRSIAWNLLGNAEDVGECLNDTWLAAWNRIPPDRPAALAVYLGRITRNIAMDRYDYNHAKKRNRDLDLLLSELDECARPCNSAEQEYAQGEVSRLISRFLRDQEPQKRAVFIRRYWYADPIRVIAAQAGMSESKVKSMLFRLRKSLKQFLENEGVRL